MSSSPAPDGPALSPDAFLAFAAASGEGVIVLDGARRMRYLNANAAEMLGGDVEGLAGESFVYPFTPDVTEEVTLAGGTEALPVELSACCTTWDGAPATLLVLKDLTSRREAMHLGRNMERQLRGAHRREAAGVLAAGLAHDFSNFLTVILGRTQLLLGNAGEDERLAHHARLLHMGAKQHSVLTQQFLSLVESGSSTPRDVVIEDTLGAIAPVIDAALGDAIELEVSVAPGVGAARIGGGRIEQMLVNLALNARDAMPAGGRVRITAEAVDVDDEAPDGEGWPVELESGRYVRIALTDTGGGMPAHVQKRAFEPFFTTKQPRQSAGLGLTVVLGIAEEAGGAAWIESVESNGTSVSIVLPGVQELRTPRLVPDVRAAGDQRRMPVLLVEDETDVRTMLREILEHLGYEVVEAEDGQHALEQARLRPGSIEFVLTDVVMPRMGGRAAVERLQSDHADLPVLYMSGYAEREIQRRGLIPEGAAYIQKPFTPDELRAAIDAVAS